MNLCALWKTIKWMIRSIVKVALSSVCLFAVGVAVVSVMEWADRTEAVKLTMSIIGLVLACGLVGSATIEQYHKAKRECEE